MRDLSIGEKWFRELLMPMSPEVSFIEADRGEINSHLIYSILSVLSVAICVDIAVSIIPILRNLFFF